MNLKYNFITENKAYNLLYLNIQTSLTGRQAYNETSTSKYDIVQGFILKFKDITRLNVTAEFI